MELTAVRRLGEELLAEHGLTRWSFGFDNAKRRAGQCRYDRRSITVSRTLMQLYSEAEVRETILHEVAHALAGPKHAHDAVWRATAKRIGCSGRRVVHKDAPEAPAPWIGTCPAGHEIDRHRRPSAPSSCLRCSRTFSPAHLLRWTFHGREVPMSASYERKLAALQDKAQQERSSSAAAFEDGPADPIRLLTVAGGLPVGTKVQVTVRGKYAGLLGDVIKVGRTRYHLRMLGQVLTVPFAGVEPLDPSLTP